MQAYLFLANKRRQREHRELLALHATAARADPKDIRKALKEDR
jgi:hypothetical protein